MHDHIDSRAAAGVQKRRPVEERIGFIGLGRMGAAMATNLVQAGCDVRAYVRRPERIKELAALGLDTTAEVADLFDCEIVVSMLPDDKVVRDVMFGLEPRPGNGLASGLMPGAIHLSMSTISTAASSAIDSGHAKLDQGYVAAPVFGNPDAAAARQLYIVAAGSGYYIERCQPIFDILGQRTFVVGPEPATANLIKLAGCTRSTAARSSRSTTSRASSFRWRSRTCAWRSRRRKPRASPCRRSALHAIG